MRSLHHRVELFDGDPHHQIAADDAAAHPTAVEKRETTEHLAFTDVLPIAQRPTDAIRELLVGRAHTRPQVLRASRGLTPFDRPWSIITARCLQDVA